MQVNQVFKMLCKVAITAITYAFVIYKEGSFATISLSTLSVMFLFRDTSNGLAMLLSGLSGLAGAIIRGDNTLLFEAFLMMAVLGFVNNALNKGSLNKYLIIFVISLVACLLPLTICTVIYGIQLAMAILKVKAIELMITLLLGEIIQYVMNRLENR